MNSIIYVCFKTYHSCMNNMLAAHPAQVAIKKQDANFAPCKDLFVIYYINN